MTVWDFNQELRRKNYISTILKRFALHHTQAQPHRAKHKSLGRKNRYSLNRWIFKNRRKKKKTSTTISSTTTATKTNNNNNIHHPSKSTLQKERSMDAMDYMSQLNQMHQLLQQQRASPLVPPPQLLPQIASSPGGHGGPAGGGPGKPPPSSRRPSAAAAKPYTCNECGRGFKYLHTLRFHVKTSHDSDGGGAEPSPTLSHRLSRMRREPAGGSTSPPSPTMSPVFPSSKRDQLHMIGQAMPLLKKSLDGGNQDDQPLSLTKRTSPGVGTIPSPPMLLSANPTPSPSSMPSPMPSPMSSPVVSTSGGYPCQGSGQQGQGSNPPTAPTTPTPQDSFHAPSIVQLMKNMHIESQTNLAIQIKGVLPDGNNTKQFELFRCGICNRTKTSLERLLGHLIWFHFADNRKRHCNKCGALFRVKDQLDNHMKLHQLAKENANNHDASQKHHKEIRTELTEDFEDRRSSIKREPEEPSLHTNSNNNQILSQSMGTTPTIHAPTEELKKKVSSATDGSLPFHCNFCDKSFDRLFSLQRHERIHTGVKPCYCKVCGRGFSERRNLRHHIIRFHAEDDIKEQFKDELRGFDVRKLGALQAEDDLEMEEEADADRDSLDREASVDRLDRGFTSSPEQPTSTAGSDDLKSAVSLRSEVPPGAMELVQRLSQSPPSPSAQAAFAKASSFLALMAQQNQLQNVQQIQNSLAAFAPPSSKRRKGIPTKYTDGPGGLDESGALHGLPPPPEGLFDLSAQGQAQTLNNNSASPEETKLPAMPTDLSVGSEH